MGTSSELSHSISSGVDSRPRGTLRWGNLRVWFDQVIVGVPPRQEGKAERVKTLPVERYPLLRTCMKRKGTASSTNYVLYLRHRRPRNTSEGGGCGWARWTPYNGVERVGFRFSTSPARVVSLYLSFAQPQRTKHGPLLSPLRHPRRKKAKRCRASWNSRVTLRKMHGAENVGER